MFVELDDRVQYWMNLDGEKSTHINPLINSEVTLEWTGRIFCINCGRSIKKTFGQGFCYKCFTESASASPCIINPELCEAHLGKGRDPEWEERNHNQPHYVYLAQTATIKVGVTRETQVPSRWIDQGAWRAVPIAYVPYRQLAGKIEVELKQYLSDRTDWRKMLRGEKGDEDILAMRDMVVGFLPSDLQEFALDRADLVEINYPVESYPEKISTIKLEEHHGQKMGLTGIRGQYLYFDSKKVINLRKYSGYEIELK